MLYTHPNLFCRNASNSLEINFIITFKTTFFVQLRYKSELKSILTYINRLQYYQSQIFQTYWHKDEIDKRYFLKISFVNKGFDTISLDNSSQI
jgi:hypothetical protein